MKTNSPRNYLGWTANLGRLNELATGPLVLVSTLLIVLAFGSNVGFSQGSGDDIPLSIDDIVKEIRQVRERFRSVRIKYTCSTLLWLDRSQQVKGFIEGVYAHKVKDGCDELLQLHDTTTYWIDPNTGARDVFQSKVCAFDGQATRKLIRVDSPEVRRHKGSRGLKEGYVYKGFVRSQFLANENGPYREVWYTAWYMPLDKSITITEFPFVIKGRENVNGLSTILLESYVPKEPNNPKSHEGIFKLWIAPERSFLPVKLEDWIDGECRRQRGLSDLILLANGVWFPLRIQRPMDEDKLAKASFFSIWEVKEISLDPIPDSFFTIEFPAGTRVYDEVVGANYTTY